MVNKVSMLSIECLSESNCHPRLRVANRLHQDSGGEAGKPRQTSPICISTIRADLASLPHSPDLCHFYTAIELDL